MCDPIGLIYYSVLIFSIYLSAFFKQKFFLKVILFFVAIFSAFRGNAGVDTPLYISRFNAIDYIEINWFEPLMPIIMKLVKFVGGDFVIFSIIWAFLIFIFYIIFLHKISNGFKLFYFILPVIYVDSLFNGLRVGLAYPIILLSFSYEKKIKNLFFSSISHFTHVTTLLKHIFSFRLKTLFFLSIILIGFWSQIRQIIPINLLYKLNRYQEFEVMNSYGGIADLSCIILILFLLKKSRILSKKYFVITLAFLIPFHVFITTEFAAILRIYRLIIICLLGLHINKFNFKLNLYLKLFGFLYCLNFLRQISSSCTYENGFLPL